MGTSPKDSNVADKPQQRKAANVVSFEEARKFAHARLGQRKEFNIARGALREGALYDPNENVLEPEPKRPKRPTIMKRVAKDAKDASKPAARPTVSKKDESTARPTVSKKSESAARPNVLKKGESATRPLVSKKDSAASEPKAEEPSRPTIAKPARAVEQVDRPSASGKKSRVAERARALREVREERRRSRTKAKADKQFDQQYGDAAATKSFLGKGRKAEAGASNDNAGGPRAAVYEGKMGALHKKSSKLQSKGGNHVSPLSGGIPMPSLKLPSVSRKTSTAIVTVIVCAICLFSLYGPAQQYYTQMRETDRLQAEYAAVAQRSDNLQASIDSLQTDAGIEDKAHTDLGYIKSGERTGTVKGIDFDDMKEFSTNVVPGSVPAPETWYSPFLDVLFNYSK